MTGSELLGLVTVSCPGCNGHLDIVVEQETSGAMFRVQYDPRDKQTYKPIIVCASCGAEYVPEISLHRRLKNVTIKCTIGLEKEQSC